MYFAIQFLKKIIKACLTLLKSSTKVGSMTDSFWPKLNSDKYDSFLLSYCMSPIRGGLFPEPIHFKQVKQKEQPMKAIETTVDKEGFTIKGRLYHTTTTALGLEPNSRYIITATKLPDGYRMVTEEERSEWPKLKVLKEVRIMCLQRRHGLNWSVSTSSVSYWSSYYYYAVPVDYTGPKKELSATLTVKCGDEEVDINQLSDETILELIKSNKGAN